jgi:hypothetical protein
MAILVKQQSIMEQETLEQVSDVTLDKTLTITVDVQAQSWYRRLLQKWGILPKKRVFELKPAYLGTLVRISRILLSIDLKRFGAKEDQTSHLLEMNYQAIVNHSGHLAEIVALAISNKDKEPPASLVSFIIRNFTTQEMLGVLGLVLKQMDLTSFMSSIISVRGLNVLERQPAAPATPVNGTEVSL